MGLTFSELLTVTWWYLVDVSAFQNYKYWLSAGLQAKYAFEKTIQVIKSRG